jgi:hypothetical protein
LEYISATGLCDLKFYLIIRGEWDHSRFHFMSVIELERPTQRKLKGKTIGNWFISESELSYDLEREWLSHRCQINQFDQSVTQQKSFMNRS